MYNMYAVPDKKKFATRYILHVFFLFGVCLNTSLFSQTASYPLVRTPQAVNVNRHLPGNILAAGDIMPARFSANPTDEEIYRVHFFEEPLVPMAGREIKGENAALVIALAGFSQRSNPDDFTSVTGFLKKYPKSRWRGALLAALGIVYRRSGYFVEATDAWQQSWNLLKQQTDRKTKLLADRVLSELLLINAWVGRQEKIDSLLKESNHRLIEGPAVERTALIRRASWLMKNKPGISFMCGPYALNRIDRLIDSSGKFSKKLANIHSTSRGFSLYELKTMANESGLNYQMAFRTKGAAVILKAVVHWKLDHYSALLKNDSGYYKCEDATMGTVYGQEFWLSPAALDSSASGYFLVPDGALPPGWRSVSPEEGRKVFGKGQEPPDPGKHVTGGDPQSGCMGCDCANDGPPGQGDGDGSGPNGGSGSGGGGSGSGNNPPMAKSNVHLAAVSLHIYDRPVYYRPPVGPPVFWDLDYHQRDSYQPANFSYSNVGPKWTFNWLSYVQDNPLNPAANADIYVMGGGTRTFSLFDNGTQSYAPELQTNDVLTRICPGCYELRHPDGSKEIYARPDGSTANGRKIFLTKKMDPYGNAINLLYDASLRIVALTDTLGQVTSISYENSSDIYKVTKVTDPFGRSASFSYDASGRLISITDMIGIVSSFTYDSGDFISKLTTPYGSTKYIKEDGPGNYRSLETQFPLGEKEKVVFAEEVEGIPFSESVAPEGMTLYNQNLYYRNTFYWDKKAMQMAPGDFTKARIYHWLHGSTGTSESGTIAPILESIKEPLENRVWYRYQGQTGSIYANQGMSSKAAFIGRVMDDGTTQLSQMFYNAIGADTMLIDQVGRTVTKKYDVNNIDLLEIRQTKDNANELLAQFTYNSQHLPLTEMNASGLITTYTYNGKGQVLTITNPRNETTTYSYDINGYLQQVTGPVPGYVIHFTYDGFGRRRSVTDNDGYTITTDYDALDRPTIITYPDSTFKQIVYNRLDAVHVRDRMGRWTHASYDSLGRINVKQDALGRVTQFIWCSCGKLAEIVDPLKQVTSFHYDIRGRLISKVYHDGKTISYQYENTISRIKEITDARGQKKQYSYYLDNNVKQIDYVNSIAPTPSVAFTYDPVHNRMSTMTDGTGVTSFSYHAVQSGPGSTMLASVDGPFANDVISYTYDSLGRTANRSVNGVPAAATYDALGRISSASNVLGNFIYNYENLTQRVSSINYPNGQSVLLSYFDNNGDHRLKQIWNKASNSTTISKFDYESNPGGRITKWTEQSGSSDPHYSEFGYDLADELIFSTSKSQATSTILKRYAYQYDKAGNRVSEQLDNSVTAASYNNVNQVAAQQDHGPMRFTGMVNEFSSIMVKNQTTADSAIAGIDSISHFEAFVKTIPGTNNILIRATDYSGNNNVANNNYNISINPGINNTLGYDDNGNIINVSTPVLSYEWDAEDRLVKITSAGGITEFIYDGLSRRVAEKFNGTIIKRWLWDKWEIIEERDASGGVVTKRFFAGGEQVGGNNYYFTADHLGSIREVIATDGITITAGYNYDPYGRRSKISGSMDADFGFSGYYYHESSKLHLALYRPYSADLGRWLSRDPLNSAELKEGPNLYTYVKNDPINKKDRLGLSCDWSWRFPFECFPTDKPRDCEAERTGCQQRAAGATFAAKCMTPGITPLTRDAFATFIASWYIGTCQIQKRECDIWNREHGF